MQYSTVGNWLYLIFLLTVGLLFTALPLPNGFSAARPELLLCFLMLGALNAPHRVGLLIAFITGILVDVLIGNVLGMQAVIQLIMIYLCLQFHRQIVMFHVIQQMLLLMICLYAMLGLQYGLQCAVHQDVFNSWLLLKPITSIVVWGVLFYPWLNKNNIVDDDFLIIQG